MMRAPLAALAAVAAVVLAGCAQVVTGMPKVPAAVLPAITSTPAPDAVVEAARHSVVKVRAPAGDCGRLLGGTGFVVAPNRVLTAAHVVAGSDSVSISADDTVLDGQVISYDAAADVAIIDVPGLAAAPLNLAGLPVAPATEAVALGFPDGGAFTALPARVSQVVDLTGPDIYRTTTVTRAVYIVSLPGGLPAGASGGPLVDRSGRVLGIMFGNDVEHADTGFALTSVELARHTTALTGGLPVWTGDCVS
ncbi:Trypsin-like peptidase domain-containing protein [Mycolicibacterium rutilum]|uniref:Trypsin-like peptidase domain-containing protein n=1 Tax=Mycolicibacterium rutilum TaxID=370526 RepID=A0A1H6LUX3_MYCRU|nr:trypsin-like peptidase domain-containing protein [Mycolicibacterium rutilum]SEH92542.1 Trypsin-like peptidase domain-containing protein [Mycolicibacterium rutilum]